MAARPPLRSATALILVDVINHFEFPGGEKLLKNAIAVAPRLAQLKKRARRAGIPTLYVNDNFGQWRSNFSHLLAYCLRDEAPGRDFVRRVAPDDEDFLILKPMHSAFYQTPLDTLLRHLGIGSVILGGLATNSCVLCTALDANMRGLKLFVPDDCSAAMGLREHTGAMESIQFIRNASVAKASSLRLKRQKIEMQ